MDVDGNRRKRKRKKKAKYFVSLLVVLALSLFFAIYDFSYSKYVVEKDVLEDSIICKAVFLENSKIYKSAHTGKVEFFKKENSKIKRGITIAKTYATNEDGMQKKLDELDDQIEKIETNAIKKELLKGDIQKSEKVIVLVMDEIQKCLLNGEYQKAKELKQELVQGVDKYSKISGDDSFKQVTVEQLTKQKQDIIDRMKDNSKTYYSQNVGIISFKFDGLEDEYDINNVLNKKVEEFNIEESKFSDTNKIETIQMGQPIFKIADNNNWYIGCKLKKESINGIVAGKNIDIRMQDSRVLSARVHKIVEQDDMALVIFRFSSYYYEYISKRCENIQIIKKQYSGLKIPIESIVKRGEIEGVYVCNVSNIVKFVPVKVLYKNDKTAIVVSDKYTVSKEGTDEKTTISTIRMYDEIILKPEKVKKSDIVG